MSNFLVKDGDKAEWGVPEGYPKKSVQTTTLMEEQELAFALVVIGTYGAFLTNALEIVGGQTYTVSWDGTEYECVCVDNGEETYIGNEFFLGSGNDTGEPFLYHLGQNAFATFDTSASHTISVKTTEEVVTPMASAFLPQATQTTYGAIKKAAHVPHVTEAPTSNDFNKLLSALREAGIMSQSQ